MKNILLYIEMKYIYIYIYYIRNDLNKIKLLKINFFFLFPICTSLIFNTLPLKGMGILK